MWYVIHTKTGFEHELIDNLRVNLDNSVVHNYIVPLFEDVKRQNGNSRITCRKMFPGYVLIETDCPNDVVPTLKKMNEFARILGKIEREEKEESEKMKGISFSPIEQDEIDFLESILDDGIMSVSYVEQVKGKKINRIIGPLAKYGNRIIKVEFGKRYAVVEADIFKKKRRIKFGLWTDADPKIPWIEEKKKEKQSEAFILNTADIGIHPGDKVRDVSGIYGQGSIFEVISVNPIQRIVRTKGVMFGAVRTVNLFADQVERII